MRIFVKDLCVNEMTTDLFVRSISEQISHGFLLKIYMWAELIRVLMDQKLITQIWL